MYVFLYNISTCFQKKILMEHKAFKTITDCKKAAY